MSSNNPRKICGYLIDKQPTWRLKHWRAQANLTPSQREELDAELVKRVLIEPPPQPRQVHAPRPVLTYRSPT